MKLCLGGDDPESLQRVGHEALSLLVECDFETLARCFGYALTYGRNLPEALRADFDANEEASLSAERPDGPTVVVKYFEPNDTGLFAAIECAAPMHDGSAVSMELIVTGSDPEKHVTIEGLRRAV